MTFLLSNWRLVLIASLGCGLLLMTSAWRVATAQRDLAIADLQNYKRLAEVAATTAKESSEKALKEAKHDYEIQKKAIEASAWANAKDRFGSCNAAGGIRLDGMFAGDPVHNNQAPVSERTVRLQEQERVALGREDIEDYARCIAVTKSMQKWVTDVDLELK